MAYDYQCGNCQYYDSGGYTPDKYPSYYKGYCSWYKTYYYPGNSCNHQRTRDNNNSNCYITTIVCDVLGKNNNDEVLTTLRYFRDEIMQKDEKYYDTLREYDVVGPIIAKNIAKDFNEDKDTSIWEIIFNNYILPVANYIKNNTYDLAVSKYKEMVTNLKEYYSITNEDTLIDNYDMSRGGHGKVYTLTNK